MSGTDSTSESDSIDFVLESLESGTKKQLEELCGSYNNPWDVLAELAQNSVDSIKEWNDEYQGGYDRNHEIQVTIDRAEKSIKIEDTGIGIRPSKAPELLAPNQTDKDGNPITIGEKGVGLTFCIFSGNEFAIDTTSVHGEFAGNIDGSYDWWSNDIGERPNIDPENPPEDWDDTLAPTETGTTIEISDLNVTTFADDQSIFDIDIERIIYLLRAKTALGYIRTAMRGESQDEDPDIDVFLTVKDGASIELDSEQIDFEYRFPHSFFNDDKNVDIKELKDDLPLDDDEKSERLHNKNVKVFGEEERSGGRKVRYYGFYMSGAEWQKLSKQNDLIGEEDDVYDIDGGIYVATRGMPTGIKLDPPRTGYGGYWSGIYMVLEYDELPFDLGRKTLTGRKSMLQDVARNVFYDELQPFLEYIRRAPPSDPRDLFRERQERFRDIRGLENLDLSEISFQKAPDRQEAGVVSIFHELVGSGILEYYHGIRSGYKQDYDFWGTYKIDQSELGSLDITSEFIEGDIYEDDETGETYVEKDVVIEFKYDCADVITDFANKRKEFDAIDIIVCWDISEDRMSNISVQEIDPEEPKYKGCNYKIVVPNDSVVSDRTKHVIALKSLIDNI